MGYQETWSGKISRKLLKKQYIIDVAAQGRFCAEKNEFDYAKGESIAMIDSRCGLHCTGCTYKGACDCGGCIETNGHPFHGECSVAICCQNKGLMHCGECPQIPCELLKQYSCDPVHGDNPHGARIEQCKRWATQ